MEIITRQPRTEEMPALRQIWKEVFGSGDVDIFFSFYLDYAKCITALHEDTPVSAGYFIPVGSISCGGLAVPCAMIYAVATKPEHRNHGYGSAVVRELTASAKAAGYPAVVLCPSDDDLFSYYSANTELREWFYARAISYTLPPQTECGRARLSRISAEEYQALRNSLLEENPHIALDLRAIEYQDLLCKHYGGGLYWVSSAGGDSCAVVEMASGGLVCIKELLTSTTNESDIISAVAAAYPALRYNVRSPVCSRTAACKRFGMLAIHDDFFGRLDMENDFPWYGLAFD